MSLRVVIHNVGHGQAIHIFTPNGKTIVIDLGSSSSFSPLNWLRESYSTIDYLMITHPHGDHIDEFLLLDELDFNIGQLWRPKWLAKDSVYGQNQTEYSDKLDAYFELSSRSSTSVGLDENVQNPSVNGGVTIKVFNSMDCGQSNINNHSGVMFLEYANSAIMIAGDNEPPSWNELLQQPDFVQAIEKTDIFMASHHGRESGYCSDLFTKKPRLCVVSDGCVQKTDATARYSQHALGWSVNHRDGSEMTKRNCVTTRSDGAIDIRIGRSESAQKPYLAVTVD